MKTEFENGPIETKTYRRITYYICYDGTLSEKFYLLSVNSIGIPEVLTYHHTLEEAKTEFDKLGKKKK